MALTLFSSTASGALGSCSALAGPAAATVAPAPAAPGILLLAPGSVLLMVGLRMGSDTGIKGADAMELCTKQLPFLQPAQMTHDA
jgi:hypothetical protein